MQRKETKQGVVDTREEDAIKVKATDSLIWIAAVGDIMYGTNFPDKRAIAPDSLDLFQHVRPYLEGADVIFGNLEGVIADDTLLQPRDCQIPEHCYRFRMPIRHAQQLKVAGFNLVSIANNHANDFKTVGRLSTQRVLDSLSLPYAGSTEKPYTIIESNSGVKIGFVAFSPNTGSIHLLRKELVLETINAVRPLCDVLIVSAHMGGEGLGFLNLTREEESYVGEKRGNPYTFSRMVIDAGADLVLGHGPHVPRALDVYKGKLIAYSLGNFMTYSRVSVANEMGYAPLLRVAVHQRTGKFERAQLVSFIQGYRRPVRMDDQERALDLMKRLTTEDIGGDVLRWENNWLFPN